MNMTAQEKRWQAEDDAHTLARAEEIKSDKSRLTAAQAEAARMVKEQEQRASNLAKVANPRKGKKKGPLVATMVGGYKVPRY